ncbi:hypothetical protein [Cytobacillus horneckiae]|uniref:tubby C-terminal domain-like protein n=1 Tax=Cytobacillus horneckiae TaxID=549687 RepID=UPI00203D17AB|nr:hypothetical protein [Cytobacillus horneckiae]MCM3180866.1 hypothetical protein [Cytobacillus horneckiae]
MKKYVYNAPKIKVSTKLVDIINNDKEVVGTFKREYKNILYQIIDSTVFKGDGFVQYNSYSTEGKLNYKVIKRLKMIKQSDYLINCYKGEEKVYTVTYQTLQDIAPEFLIESRDERYVIKKMPMDWARVYYKDKEVARWKMKTTELFKVYMEIEEDSPIQDPTFFSCLFQCILYVGD